MAATGKLESESSAKEKANHAGLTFLVGLDGDGAELERPRSAPPKRLRNYQKKTTTREELEQKQSDAEKRRKEREREMVKRVQQSREDVERLNKNFSALLEQDAKRQGAAGTSDIPAMSRQQLREKFQSVNRDYNKMVKSISSTARVPD